MRRTRAPLRTFLPKSASADFQECSDSCSVCRIRAGKRCVSASGFRCARHAVENRGRPCQRSRTVARAGSTHPTLTTSIIPRPYNFVTNFVSIFLPFLKLKNRILVFYFFAN